VPGARPRHRLAGPLAALAALLLLTTACTGVPDMVDGAESDGLSVTNAPGAVSSGVPSGVASAAPRGSGRRTPVTTPGQITAASGAGAHSTSGAGAASGAPFHAVAQGQPIPGSERGNGKGVSDKFITIAFHYPTQDCGGTKAYSKDDAERIDTLVRWFNQYVPFPGGRKLKYSIVDDGGSDPQCWDKTRAAGTYIANDLKAFAALGFSQNPGADEPIIADTVTHYGTLHIGYNFNTHADFEKRAPYAWSFPKDGETAFDDLSYYIKKRILGTSYVDDAGAKHQRVWGTLFMEGKEGKDLAAINVKLLHAMGITTVKQYYLSGDTGSAAQNGSALALQMKRDGVNTVIYGISNVAGYAASQAFDGQQYHPDNLISDYGGYWFALFNDVYGQGQLKRMQGVSAPCVPCSRLNFSATETETKYPQDNEDASLKAYEQAHGSSTDPSNNTRFQQHWSLLSMLALGILNAGPVLNPWTFQYGMFAASENRCQVGRFFGRDHPQFGHMSWKPGQYAGTSGVTSLYWTAKQSQFGTAGYFESYDNYLRFDAPSLPARPSHDTGKTGFKQIWQKPSGLRPDKAC